MTRPPAPDGLPPAPDPSYHPLYGGRASIENRRKLARAVFATRAGRWVLLALVVAFAVWLVLR
jgi:hypothetical protein